MQLATERNEIVCFGKKLIDAKLTTGTSGNLSIANRGENLVAISPTGIDYFETTPEDVVVTDMDRYGQFAGRWARVPGGSRNPVILSVNRSEVENVRDYRDAMKDVGPGDVVSLLVYDPAQRQTVPVSVQLPSTPR